MIIEHYPSKRVEEKAPWYVPPTATVARPFEIGAAKARSISVEEFMRRDAIVKRQYQECPYNVGDLVYPHTLKLVAQYGMCKVKGIVQTYLALPPSEEWPTSDLPFLVLAYPLKDPAISPFNATTNFFQKEYPKA